MRCRYCRGSGHNITNCQSYKSRIEELRSLHGNDHYAVASYDSKKQRQTRKVEDKTCSFCENKGHTRRTCPDVSSAKETISDLNTLFRKAVLLNHYNSKTGVGSIVSVANRWEESEVSLFLCKSIRVADINIWDNGYSMNYVDYYDMTKAKSFKYVGYDYHDQTPSTSESRTFINVAKDWNRAKIMSPSQNVPTDLDLNNKVIIDEVFSSKSKNFPTKWHATDLARRSQDLYDRRQQIEEDFDKIGKGS